MEIFPAIDLKNGQCVRLTQGDFSKATIYEVDPLAQAKKFADAGAVWLHVVDLDGAKAGEMAQLDMIAQLAKTSLKVQAGGGIRHERTIESLLNAGVKRVIIGSLAVKNRQLVESWIKRFGPEHIVLAFDIKFTDGEPEILTHGWQSGSKQLLWDVVDAYITESGLKTILCTDVDRDGMLEGSNHNLYRSIKQRWPQLEILASGGVNDLDNLLELRKLGATGAIVGKAIYEGRISLADAIQQVQHAG
jgi:phosphoribosylformimino-5-aminoimidazole carboxamide ribotide isomerase